MAAGTGRPSLKFCGEQLGRDDQNSKNINNFATLESPY
jgi:hypothetical protein